MTRPLSSHEHRLLANAIEARDGGRWTTARKAAVVSLVRQGALTQVQACEQFDLSAEELASWVRLEEAHGAAGLSVMRLQQLGGRT